MTLSHSQRAAVFIDGGNFFHRMGAKLRCDVNQLDYRAFGQKLVAPCRCRGIRYYAGQVANNENSRAAYAAQRRLLARLKLQNVHVRLGRIEKRQYSGETVWQEKGVDMMCGIDMVSMAFADEYDVAYLVSSDGDFAPAIEMARGQFKKRVFVCAPDAAHHLRRVADNFLLLSEENFRDCWL